MTYAVVRPVLWRALRAASDRERVLAAYLLTADVRRPAGLLRLPAALAASDLAWPSRKVEAALAALEAAGFLLRDAGAELVFLAAWRDHDALPNCAAACSAGRQLRDHVREAPDSPAVKAALVAFGEESARLLALAPASDAAAPQLRKLLAALPRRDGPPHGPPDGPPDGARDRRDMDMGGDLQPCPSNNAGDGSPSGSPGVSIPLKDGGTFTPTPAQLTEWRAAFPRVDVEAELRHAAAWCSAAPERRKTRRGVARFIVGWLSRAKPTQPTRSAAAARDAAADRLAREAVLSRDGGDR